MSSPTVRIMARKELAKHLRENHLRCAAQIVLTDARDAESIDCILVDAESHWRAGSYALAATKAIVMAWRDLRDADVIAAFAAWERRGCEACAIGHADRKFLGTELCSSCSEIEDWSDP